MKNICIKFMTILAAVLFMTACSNEKNEQNNTMEETDEYVYVADFYEYDTGNEWFNWVSSITAYGNKLIVVSDGYHGRPISSVRSVNMESGVVSDFDLGLDKERYIVEIVSTGNGYVIYSEDYYSEEEHTGYGNLPWKASYLTYCDSDFRIELEARFYTNELFPAADTLNDAITRFNIDLVSGNIGDIIIVTPELDYYNLASKDALADLGELMAQDVEIDEGDFIDNIIDLLRVDGKIYGIAPRFCITTLVGKVSNVGAGDSWNSEDIVELMEEHENSTLLYGFSNINALRLFLMYSMDSYYDIKTGECSFDSEEFKRIAEEMVKDTSNTGASYNNFSIKLEPLSEADVEYIRKLVYGATRSEFYDNEVMNIILEEAKKYYSGEKSAEETARIIQSRVSVYVEEKR